MKKLLTLLKEATAIQIDDAFIISFDLETDDGDPYNLALDINFTDEYHWEWEFTFDDINNAVFNKDTNDWSLNAQNEDDLTMTLYTIG